MPDVFISYKREERPRCQRIADKLIALNLNVWFDAQLESGKSFPQEIKENVTTARVVLVLWSPASVESEWVQEEASIGKKRGVLVTAQLSPCEPPMGFTLRHHQELFDADFSDDDPAWRNVLESIGRFCHRKDIEEWATLGPQASAIQLRAWIAAHPDSPASLFLDVDARQRARAAADEQRAREEREARWRHAIEGLNRQSSSAVRTFREKWPDHPEDEALRLSLPAIELAERQQAEREAFEQLDKTSSKGVREFLQKSPSHPRAEALRVSLPKVEEAERQLSKEQEANRERVAKEGKKRARSAEVNRRVSGLTPLLFWVGGIVAVLVIWRVMSPGTEFSRVTAPPTIGGVFVRHDFCPGEGCDKSGHWPATGEVPVYARPEDSAPVIARVAPGEWVDALTSEVHVVPVRGRVLSSGEVAYRLAYAGEGYWSVWRNGQIEVADGSDFEFGTDPNSQYYGVQWVQIRRSDGSQGWIQDTNSFGCTGRYSEHPGCWTDPDRNSQRAEDQTFNRASEYDTIEAFETFLVEYPNRAHAPAARGRIAELRSRVTPLCRPGSSGGEECRAADGTWVETPTITP